MKLAAGHPHRIIVVGTSCAGKTSFAKELSRLLAVPRIELDELFWGPHWTPKPEATFRQLVISAAAADAWVADGNYRLIREALWTRATMIVWLNYGFSIVFWRAMKRTVTRCLNRDELWHGNRESIRRSFFSKQSILWWIATTYRRRQREFSMLRESGEFKQLSWVEFRSPSEAKRSLMALQSAS